MKLIDLLLEIEFLLDIQKESCIFQLSLIESQEQKLSFIKNFRNDYFNRLISGENRVVNENVERRFGNKLIYESDYDLLNEINDVFTYIKNILVYENNLLDRLNEGFFGDIWDKTKEVAGQVGSKIKSGIQSAANFIKEKGIGTIFEGLRKALMSGVGTAIQIALSFTGVGAIAVDVAWAIMLNYDLFMMVSGSPNWFNIVIDILCLLTAGGLGKVLGKWAGKSAKSLSDAISWFFKGESAVGKVIVKWMPKIEQFLGWGKSKLQQAANFIVEKMGLNWAKNGINKGITLIDDTVKFLKTKTSELTKNLSKKVAGKTVTTLSKSSIYNNLSKQPLLSFLEKGLSQKWLETTIYGQLNKGTIQTVEKYIKDKLKNFSDEQITGAVEKYYGKQYAELIKKYSNIMKSAKEVAKSPNKSVAAKKGKELVKTFAKEVTPKQPNNQQVNQQALNPKSV
jgi:hypothetical protein